MTVTARLRWPVRGSGMEEEGGGAPLHHPLRIKNCCGGGGDIIGIVPASASAFVDVDGSTLHAQQAVICHQREVVVLLVSDNGAPPPPIIVAVIAVADVGGGVIDGGVMDQAIAKDAMDAEAAALFVVGIIIVPTPPKIIVPPFERSIPSSSSKPSSSLHCLLTHGGQIRVGGM